MTDSPLHAHPMQAPAWGEVRWGGGNPLWVYLLLDTQDIDVYIYIYIYICKCKPQQRLTSAHQHQFLSLGLRYRRGSNTTKAARGSSCTQSTCKVLQYIDVYIHLSINKSVHLVAGISQNRRINMDLEIIESTRISQNHE